MLNGIKRTCDTCGETFHFSLKHKCETKAVTTGTAVVEEKVKKTKKVSKK